MSDEPNHDIAPEGTSAFGCPKCGAKRFIWYENGLKKVQWLDEPDVVALRARVPEMQAELDALHEQLDHASDSEALTRERIALNAASTWRAEVERLVVRLERAEDTERMLERIVGEQQAQIAELNRQVATNAPAAERAEHLRVSLEAAAGTLAALEPRAAAYQAEAARLQADVQRLQGELAGREAERDGARIRAVYADAARTQATVEHDGLRKHAVRVPQLEHDLAQAQAEAAALRAQVAQLSETQGNAALAEALGQARRDLRVAQAQLVDARAGR